MTIIILSRGASGAGKTTLLNVLAGYAKGDASVSGTISINGEAVDGDKIRRISGFVHQVCGEEEREEEGVEGSRRREGSQDGGKFIPPGLPGPMDNKLAKAWHSRLIPPRRTSSWTR